MNRKKAKRILCALWKHYPNAKIMLSYSNNFELLIAVMLSAQTTDIQVNKVTSALFPKYRLKKVKLINEYKNYKDIKIPRKELVEMVNFSAADLKKLENDIKSIGLYRNKARNIKLASQMLLAKFNGRIPKTMAGMLELPGVGRKTANVVLGNAYGIVKGVAVDTHVKRLSLAYGFTKQTDPEKIERDLMKLFDRKDWFRITYLLIEHGRNVRKTKRDFILRQEL